MKFNLSGLLVAAVFYGVIWYAFERGVDHGFMRALAAVALSAAVGWLSVGVITHSPLAPLWPRCRVRR